MNNRDSKYHFNIWPFVPGLLMFLAMLFLAGYLFYFGHTTFSQITQSREEAHEVNLQMTNLATEKIKGKSWEEIKNLSSDNDIEVRVISPNTVYLIFVDAYGKQVALRLYPEGQEPKISSHLIYEPNLK